MISSDSRRHFEKRQKYVFKLATAAVEKVETGRCAKNWPKTGKTVDPQTPFGNRGNSAMPVHKSAPGKGFSDLKNKGIKRCSGLIPRPHAGL